MKTMASLSPDTRATTPTPHIPLPAMPRRRWLSWGLAGLGMGALASSSWAASETNKDPLWDMVLPAPDGGRLVMAEHRGKPLIINFWATWCAPCVEELPLLGDFHAKNNGWDTIGIAVDTPANVQRFVQRFALTFPIGIAGTAGLRLSKELGNTGGLPYTLVVDKKGMIRERKIGQINATDLANWELLA